jgi:glutaredoxin 3
MSGYAAIPRRCTLLGTIALAIAFSSSSCGNPLPGEDGKAGGRPNAAARPDTAKLSNEAGNVVAPPFAVRGELDGLLLVWFDQAGTHTAKRRSEIPEGRRSQVRVESLSVAPGQRLDPEHVYVADLRAPAAGGSYPVRTHTRDWFDAQVDGARPVPKPTEQASSNASVTIYKASWCGACRAAAAYLRSRNVQFVEKDIEKDAEANAEMLRKAAAAGKRPSGVPVIDFGGQIIMGFDQATLDRLIERSKPI